MSTVRTRPVRLESEKFLFSILFQAALMAGYRTFDSRLESLVVEMRTEWSVPQQNYSSAKQNEIAHYLHSQPRIASKIEYVRTHTGFIRVITVEEPDIQQFDQQKPAVAGVH
ncbi:hypothetical protein SH668x_002035 [Planctomicrobium sp. SH668]|uniref:hypothetical protein n=1 Tax=Planctomicrobium sp. SH668 TaxID=3448126 RepID=UPI003F5BF476